MKRDGKNKKDFLRDLLYRSLDRKLSSKDLSRLGKGLEESSDLRKERDQLLKLRQSVSEGGRSNFRPYFAERVMTRIESLPKMNGLESFYYSLRLAFKRMVLVGAVILLALLLYNFRMGDSLSSDEVFFASDLTVQEILDYSLF